MTTSGPPTTPDVPSTGAPITVVGIGASAGGLAALRELLRRLPARTGAAFVIVVHLAPDRESHLADLLQIGSVLPVRQVSEPTRLEADHVYVIPPNRNLSAIDSHLRLTELDDHPSRRHPIDHFFRTLAEAHDGRSIGVVLTGTGSDGTAGLSMIRGHGGVTIAQDPQEAEYEGMPRSAILAQAVDLVLPLSEIAARITDLAQSANRLAAELGDADATGQAHEALRAVLSVVHQRLGYDLSGYKESTILRRMHRRVQLHRLPGLREYVDFVAGSSDEVELLFNDLLIPVTNFFRDREVFDELARTIVPPLFDGKGRDDHIRIWSVGCATGEEPFSLAMVMFEHAATLTDPPEIQIFASDLHDASLDRARHGVYPVSIEADVGPDRLRRFFTPRDGGFAISHAIRESVVFAKHDLLSDPPFSHMDLISCRNLLIYLRRDVQRAVAQVLHHALGTRGVLVLGSSESLDRRDIFDVIDKKRGFLRRLDIDVAEPPQTIVRSGPSRAVPVGRPSTMPPRDDLASLHHSLLARHGPPSLLLDANDRVLRFSSHVDRYVSHPGGAPTTDAYQLVDERLRVALRVSVHAARSRQTGVRSRPVATTTDGAAQHVVVRVVPLADDDMVLVMFEDVEVSTGSAPAGEGFGVASDLSAELEDAHRRLESVIEEYWNGQEHMRASNDELQSMNEELRSAMEELETSKEELQSTNEELSTLNQENRHKVAELAMLSSDLQNLLTATNIATLFLDRQLRIVRHTPPVSTIFSIGRDDGGRPLTDFTNRLGGHPLSEDVQRVLDLLVPIERELLADDGRWLLTRILPYRTEDDRIEGVVITFVDITRRVEAEASVRSSERALRLALDAASMGTWWCRDDGDSGGDPHTYEIIGNAGGDGSFVERFASRLRDVDRPRWWELVRAGRARDVEFELDDAAGRTCVQINLRDASSGPLEDGDSVSRRGTIRDVTETVRTLESLSDRSRRLTLLADAAEQLLRGSEPRVLLPPLLAELSAILGFEFFEQFELDADGGVRRVSGNAPWSSAGTASADADLGLRLGAEAIRRCEPVVRHALDPGRHGEEDHRVTAYGCVPLIAGGEALGALAFATSGTGRLDHDGIELVQTVADYVANAELRLRREEELRELNRSLESRVVDATMELRGNAAQMRQLASDLVRAEQTERQRIAQMLHDDVQQLLFGAQTRLGLLRDDIASGRLVEVDDHLAAAERYLAETLDKTRHLTAELAPSCLDSEDLAETVQALVAQMRAMHDLEVEVRQSTPLTIADRSIRLVVHQILRELLFNVVKHANVSSVRVEISLVGGEISIEVSDAGLGFVPDDVFGDPARNRRGLATMRQRLELVGGSLAIESIPGDGTRARVRLPIRAGGDRST